MKPSALALAAALALALAAASAPRAAAEAQQTRPNYGSSYTASPYRPSNSMYPTGVGYPNSGSTYRPAAGAPLPVSSWAGFGRWGNCACAALRTHPQSQGT